MNVMPKRTQKTNDRAGNEKFFSAILHLAHDAIIVMDEDQKIIIFNEGAERIFGYKTSEVTGQPLDLLLPQALSEIHRAHVRKFAASPDMARQMDERLEISGRRKDGSIFPAEAGISKIPFEGRFVFVAILRDVTERKRAEEALRKCKETHRMVLNGIDEIVYQIRQMPEGQQAGIVEFVSERTQEILGYPPGEFIVNSHRWFDLIHPEDIPALETQTAKIVTSGRPGMREYRIRDINGDYRWMEDRISPGLDETGRVVRIYGVARDVTEQKRAVQALKEREAFSRGVLDSLPAHIVVLDAHGVIVAVNEVWQSFARENSGNQQTIQPVGTNYLSVIESAIKNGDESAQAALDGILAVLSGGQDCVDLEYACHSPEDQRWFVMRVRPLSDQSGGVVISHQSITQRKLAEKAFQESEMRYRDVVESASDIIFSTDLSGMFTHANAAALRAIGYSLEDLRKFSYADVVRPDYRRKVQTTYFRQFLGKTPSSYIEFPFLTSSGEARWFGQTASPIFEGQSMVGFHVIARDITERVQAEEALRLNEARFRALIENNSDAIALISADGTILYESPAVTRVLGYAVGERTGRGFFELVHPDDLPNINNRFAQLLQQPGVTLDAQLRYRHKDGSWRWLEGVGQNLFTEPSVQAIVANYRDITERKQAEDALRNAEASYRVLFEQSPHGVLLLDLESGKTIEANEIAHKQLGYTREEFAALRVSDYEALENPEETAKRIQKIVREGSDDFETLHRTKSGEIRNVHVWVKTHPLGDRVLFYAIFQDITERKLEEQALRLAEEKYRAIFENVHEGIYQTTPEGRFINANPALARLLGYASPEELIATVTDIGGQSYVDPAQREEFKRLLEEHDTINGLVSQSRRKDGRVIWVSENAHAARDESGKLLYYEGTVVDITEQMQAEEALRKSEERYRSLYENNTLGLYRTTPDGQILLANPALVRMLGFASFDELSARNLEQEGYEPSYSRSQYLEMMEKQGDVKGLESAWMRKDGSTLFIRESAHAIRDAQGIILYFDGTVEDITERKQAEEALRKSEEKYRSLIDTMSEGLGVQDKNGLITFMNKRACEMLGYELDELIGKPVTFVFDEENQKILREQMKRRIEGERQSYEIAWLRKDGGRIDTIIAPSPRFDEKGDFFESVAVFNDITERKRADERIQDQLRRLAALRAIDAAITGSFDLRLTLSVVLEQVTAQLGVDAASVLLLNPYTQTLTYAAGRGFRSKAIEKSNMRLGEGHAGRAALERRVVHIPSLPESGSSFVRADLLADDGFMEYYAVPLIAKGQVKGVLDVFCRAPLSPTIRGDEWLNFLETLAGQTAIAVDNNHLFDDMQRANMELALAYDATIEGWSRALDLRDKETEGHTLRVTEMTERLAQAMGISEAEMIHIRRGALLHDIGKMGVPDGILLKPGKLTDEEWIIMRRHPQFAFDMLAPITYLRPALDIPGCHHEKWDGSGYPRGLKGEQIPQAARIFAVVDVWDALRSDRPYRAAWPEDKTLEHIRSLSGTHFDPKGVEAFMKMIEQ
jgi:PAS domain S-box-containing protein/putative nucleotidyltransferase with HDIG domain